MSELLVLQHHPETGPAGFLEVLDSRATLTPWRLVDVGSGEPVPEHLDGIVAVLTLGGPMSVTRPDEHPWMRAELGLLRDAVEAGRPVLGVCLGAQLLGAALGGDVAARQVPRAAFTPLRRTAAGTADEVTAGWPDDAWALFMHEDEVVRYPSGAQPLLSGPGGEVVAWGVGTGLAVQAHLEVTTDQLGRWASLAPLDDLLARAGTDPAALLAEAARRERFSLPLGRAFVGRWLDGPVRAAVG